MQQRDKWRGKIFITGRFNLIKFTPSSIYNLLSWENKILTDI